MTEIPWSAVEVPKWEKLAKEAHAHNDIVIGPYLDGRLVVWLIGRSFGRLVGWLVG